MPNWITGPPTLEQVAEHLKNQGGLWMLGSGSRFHGADITHLSIFDDKIMGYLPSENRYLPIATDGLPVDYAALRKVEETAVRLVAKLDSLDAGCDGTTMPQIASLRAALKELEESQ